MNKIITAIILLSGFMYCCSSDINFDNIRSVKVYSIPFGILTPMKIGDEWIQNKQPKWIRDDNEILLIRKNLNKLVKTSQSLDKESIYMRCIYYTNNDSLIFNYDKFVINIDGVNYEDSPDLISLLVDNSE